MNYRRLNDVCLNITDGTHSTVKDDSIGNCYLLSCKNVKNGFINISNTDRRINEDTLKLLRKRTKMGYSDIILTTVGTIGESAIVRDISPNFEFQRSAAIIKADQNAVLPKYLHYFFCSDSGQTSIKSRIKGAAQPCLFLNDLKNIEIPILNLTEQQHIVDTIGTIDELIEKNEEFCSTFQKYLSFMYQDINDGITNYIPLSDLVVRTGKTLKHKEWYEKNVMDLSTMPLDNIFINTFSNGSNFKTNIKTINEFDLTYGSIRPYFKKAGFALEVNFIAGSVFSFKPKKDNDYLWFLATICSTDFHNFTEKNSQGTKMPMINWDTFGTYKTPYDKEAIDELNSKIRPLFEDAVNKAKEIRRLKEIKAKLLSKYF